MDWIYRLGWVDRGRLEDVFITYVDRSDVACEKTCGVDVWYSHSDSHSDNNSDNNSDSDSHSNNSSPPTRGDLGGGRRQPLPLVILAIDRRTGHEVSEAEGVSHVGLVQQLHEVVDVGAIQHLGAEGGGRGRGQGGRGRG